MIRVTTYGGATGLWSSKQEGGPTRERKRNGHIIRDSIRAELAPQLTKLSMKG